MSEDWTKPLGHKSYGSIGHLPESRRGPGDKGITGGQQRIATEKCRPHDLIIVQEKLDGANVAIANIDGQIVALQRAGYRAEASKYPHLHLFADWVRREAGRFEWIPPGSRLCGEWLALAHGTRYELFHEPFVAFDYMVSGHERLPYFKFCRQLNGRGIPVAHTLHIGGALSVAEAMRRLGSRGFHGAVEDVEGAVWRIEHRGEVQFLAKYVRPGKVDGCYLPKMIDGALVGEEIWNWRP